MRFFIEHHDGHPTRGWIGPDNPHAAGRMAASVEKAAVGERRGR